MAVVAALLGGMGAAKAAMVVPPPDGEYRCVLSFMVLLGRIEVNGAELRSLVKGDSQEPYRYDLTETGRLAWEGKLNFFHREGLRVMSGRVVDTSGAPLGLTFLVKTRGGKYRSVHCAAML